MRVFADEQNFLRMPENLDMRFGLAAGGYVAALLSPILVLVLVKRLQLRTALLALAVLAAVGTIITGFVAWGVTRRGDLLVWFNRSWLVWLLPAVGVIPMVSYLLDAILYLGIIFIHPEPGSTANLVGAVGFVFGMAAVWLGGRLVFMARTRLARAMVTNRPIDIEWTASWPRSQLFKYAIGALSIGVVLFVLVTIRFGVLAGLFINGFTLYLILVINHLSSERTYRATPEGLEQELSSGVWNSRIFTSWSRFDGYTVTDQMITLHRPWPHSDVRLTRPNLVSDEKEEVVSALEAYLNQKNP